MTRTRLVIAATIAGLVMLTLALAYESLNQEVDAQLLGYQSTGDTHKIVLVVGAGILDDVGQRLVEEDDRSVTVRVRLRKFRGAGGVPAVLVYLPVTVSLKDQLGSRSVRDAHGNAVPDLGPYQPPR